MAVYTSLPDDALREFIERYQLGPMVSAKGIAEGVENTNYLIATARKRVILTIYEQRTSEEDLPFFLGLLDYAARQGLPVPRPITDRDDVILHKIADRSACLFEYLPGETVREPTSGQTHAAGAMLGQLHAALAGIQLSRANGMGPQAWLALAQKCRPHFATIGPGLEERIDFELSWLRDHWPDHLPRAIIHADLFPDNVLVSGDSVTGLLDFYFACEEIRAWDIAIAHAAWCFSDDGGTFSQECSRQLMSGFGLTAGERKAMPALARGACLRFLLTRCWDWINSPTDGFVQRKDPLAFLRRLNFYAEGNEDLIFG
jgi:homoserine kinase type II